MRAGCCGGGLSGGRPVVGGPGREAAAGRITSFNTGEYRQSITILQRAAGVSREPDLLGSIHLYVGLSYFVLGQQSLAREAFATAVTHDPELTLDPSRFKMLMVELFNQV